MADCISIFHFCCGLFVVNKMQLFLLKKEVTVLVDQIFSIGNKNIHFS